MAKQVTITQAHVRLSALVRSAEHGIPVLITRRGRVVAAIVAADDLERLKRLRAAAPQAGLAGLAGGWEGSDEFVGGFAARRRSPPRWSPAAG